MFSSRAARIQNADAVAAETKQRADAYRKETEAGIRNARGSRFQPADNAFIHGWKPRRDAEQAHLDSRAVETAKAAKKAKRSWW